MEGRFEDALRLEAAVQSFAELFRRIVRLDLPLAVGLGLAIGGSGKSQLHGSAGKGTRRAWRTKSKTEAKRLASEKNVRRGGYRTTASSPGAARSSPSTSMPGITWIPILWASLVAEIFRAAL